MKNSRMASSSSAIKIFDILWLNIVVYGNANGGEVFFSVTAALYQSCSELFTNSKHEIFVSYWKQDMPEITTKATIQDVEVRDHKRIADIYGYHVPNGLASFEESPPDAAEISRRFDVVRALDMPYIVAELDSDIVGCAFAALIGHARPIVLPLKTRSMSITTFPAVDWDTYYSSP